MNTATLKKESQTLHDRVSKRNAVIDRIKNLKQEISSATMDLQKAERELREANERLTSYQLSVDRERGAGSDSPRYEAELQSQKQEVQRCRESHKSAEERLDALQRELKQLEVELGNCEANTSLQQVLAHQNAVSEARKRVTDLQNIISEQASAAQQAVEQEDSVDQHMHQREELLADVALGNASIKDLKALDAEIESASKDAEKVEMQRVAQFRHARQTIAGLQRRLAVAQGELLRLEALTPQVLDQFLMSEAEKEASQYLQHATALIANFKRLMALESVIASLGERQEPILTTPRARKLLLPMFKTSCFEGISAQDSNLGTLFAAQYSSHELNQEIHKEKSRLIALGLKDI